MRSLFLIFLAILGVEGVAHGGGFNAKTSRDALSSRAVEQPLVLPRGWVALSVGYDQHIGTGSWTADGDHEAFDEAAWTYYTERLRLTYGISRRAEMWWEMPFHQARLTNEALWGPDEKIYDHSIGDPRFGYKFHILDKQSPTTSVAFEAWYKGPAAQESPASYIGGPLLIQGFTFTTGTPDAYLGFAGKRQLGPLGITAHAGYLRRFSGIVQYLVELNETQFSGRINPGDQIRADLGLQFQLGPVAIGATPLYTHRFTTRIGTGGNDSKWYSPSKNLRDVSDSDGDALDLRAELTINASRGLALTGYYLQPLMGEDLLFFPIEELSPTYGPSFGGVLEVRY